jgi:AcrR family transcriptional regulator
MPRVTESYREARREEIALAALRCIERSGLGDTTIADIVRESGLSAGAIYSNFTNKAELARYVVAHFLGVRRTRIEDGGRRGEVRSPRELLGTMLSTFRESVISPAVPLQFWAAAAVDPGLREELDRTIAEISASLRIAVAPWVAARQPDRDLDEVVRGITALAQGYIVHVAVLGPREVDDYLDAMAAALPERD